MDSTTPEMIPGVYECEILAKEGLVSLKTV